MNEIAIQSVRHELEQSLVHLNQASDVLYYLRALAPKEAK